MNVIIVVLRIGCQWNALNAAGIRCSSSAHRHSQEWHNDGVFEWFLQNGLLDCAKLGFIDWTWLSMDGCVTKPPLVALG